MHLEDYTNTAPYGPEWARRPWVGRRSVGSVLPASAAVLPSVPAMPFCSNCGISNRARDRRVRVSPSQDTPPATQREEPSWATPRIRCPCRARPPLPGIFAAVSRLRRAAPPDGTGPWHRPSPGHRFTRHRPSGPGAHPRLRCRLEPAPRMTSQSAVASATFGSATGIQLTYSFPTGEGGLDSSSSLGVRPATPLPRRWSRP